MAPSIVSKNDKIFNTSKPLLAKNDIIVKKYEKGSKMKKRWLLALVFTCLLFVPSLVFAVDFDILSYKGDLNIHADNTAVFKETITYHFKDDFNGQLIGLGKAGKMPNGFEIDDKPTVLVSKNGQIVQDVLSYTKEEEDGYKVTIFNPGTQEILFV